MELGLHREDLYIRDSAKRMKVRKETMENSRSTGTTAKQERSPVILKQERLI